MENLINWSLRGPFQFVFLKGSINTFLKKKLGESRMKVNTLRAARGQKKLRINPCQSINK